MKIYGNVRDYPKFWIELLQYAECYLAFPRSAAFIACYYREPCWTLSRLIGTTARGFTRLNLGSEVHWAHSKLFKDNLANQNIAKMEGLTATVSCFVATSCSTTTLICSHRTTESRSQQRILPEHILKYTSHNETMLALRYLKKKKKTLSSEERIYAVLPQLLMQMPLDAMMRSQLCSV